MKYKFFTLFLITFTMINNGNTQTLNLNQVKQIEHLLADVMELVDTNYVKEKMLEVEQVFEVSPTEINKVRLGIIYHEAALNLSFLSTSAYQGYALKSVDLLSSLFDTSSTTEALMPFIAAYRASAISLMSAETNNLKLLSEAFTLFEDAVNKYGTVCYLPEFLRGSVAENLPWFFFSKRKAAIDDFQSIIDKQQINPDFANWKIMSFTYWAWANQHQGKKYRSQALDYLEKAIRLDPEQKAGGEKAVALKQQFKK